MSWQPGMDRSRRDAESFTFATRCGRCVRSTEEAMALQRGPDSQKKPRPFVTDEVAIVKAVLWTLLVQACLDGFARVTRA